MRMVPHLEYNDITIKDDYTGEYPHERCKAGLWSIHNVIKKIIAKCQEQRVLECLCYIGVHARFENDNMDMLIFSGKSHKGYKRGLPAAKYLFELEKYGFKFDNVITVKPNTPLNKLAVKDIMQLNLSYTCDDFSDVIFGLKLFCNICATQNGIPFLTGDIRTAFEGAPKLYAPPVDEVFSFLNDELQRAAYEIHDKLEAIGCKYNLEREFALHYQHPKKKGTIFAVIYAEEQIHFWPTDKKPQLVFRLVLRNIGKYVGYLDQCTEMVRQDLLNSIPCSKCSKNCGGIVFIYQNKTHIKCPQGVAWFLDFSEKSVENYMNLIELENQELCKKVN